MDTTNTATIETNCMNCGGAGRIDAYKNISNGICFRCDGTGRETVAVEKAALRGETLGKPVAKDFTYAMRDGSFQSFVIYADGTSNRGTVATARAECKAVIAAGGELIESTDNTR